ncbi:MAG: rRNA maturation RNase YbeY [Candidatus Omnitrophica bacterium]|nr:rRNA maturation RNase YbeY [Candidatus Omnitrophota bacterium]
MKIQIKNLKRNFLVPSQEIKRAVHKTLQYEGRPLSAGINIIFVSDGRIRELNKKFLKVDQPTDVLVFDLGSEKDIVISVDTAVRQAKYYRTSLQYELCFYVIHGVLHLLGYDDKLARQRRIMQERAKKIIKGLTDAN